VSDWVTVLKSGALKSQCAQGRCHGVDWGGHVHPRTGVDMSTPLLPEVIPEIDTNPVNFSRKDYGGGVGQGFEVLYGLCAAVGSALPTARKP